jgi:hypothetical protein
MSYLSLNEKSFAAIGIVVPQGKAIEFVAVLALWTCSLVFLIAAWAQAKHVGVPQSLESGNYDSNVDKTKTFIILNSMSQAFFLLSFFFLLRVALSPL